MAAVRHLADLHSLADTYIAFQVERLQREVLTINQAKKEAIVKALMASRGKPTKAARLLNVSRSSMYRMMKRYGI